jgi:hypothetical protein
MMLDHAGAVALLQRLAHRKGPADFAEFLAVGGKQWRWHIGNYP